MDKHTVESILFFFDRMIEAREKYNAIKQNEAERQTSTLLGRRALYYDIILLIFVGGAAALAIWGMTIESGWRIALYILAGIIAVAMIPFYIIAFNFSIKQLCLNKRAIGWITLLLPILIAIAVAVCITVFAFSL
ncbi:MAG: hypothetical protein J1F66_05315 [Clostridiales bacterium]|nr:hypothetical protein [Clostridiales bacterium]